MQLVLLQNELRISDNPALHAACACGPCLVVYIHDNNHLGPWRINPAQQWWLQKSLKHLKDGLERLNVPLIIRCGDTLQEIKQLVEETKASALHYNRRYDPYRASFGTIAIPVYDYQASLLVEPWDVKPAQSAYYRVFTPFWKACQQLQPFRSPLPIPKATAFPFKTPKSASLQNVPTNLMFAWEPGEEAAHRTLKTFLDNACANYTHGRDLPAETLTSSLSPYLHFGEISPAQVWTKVNTWLANHPSPDQRKGAETFLKELGWREFCYHLLYHYPELPQRPFNINYQHFPWKDDEHLLKSWQQGQTGYPLIDAGMRQLKATGWMHNRVRMIVASFLTKDLLIPWQRGAEWFWEKLVDADLANNSANWQWVAGCGADAAPFFRIFNPVTQSEKFDPDARYIKTWVPELRQLPAKQCHAPWTVPKNILSDQGVILGKTYPFPIIDHAEARVKALELFASHSPRSR